MMLRIAMQLLTAFFVLFVCIQTIAIVTAWLFWPHLLLFGNRSTHYEIFVVTLCALLFLLTLLLIGWYLGKPVYFMMVWIRLLASGQYHAPHLWNELHSRKRGMLKLPYAVYKELFEHLRMLTSTLRRNEEALQESEQMKREWIRGISHDLKTPLTYISGYSAMLMNSEYRWSVEEQREFLSIIHQKAVHLQELVQDLNESPHGQFPLKAEEVDIVELVRRTVADISSAPWATGYLFTMDSEPDRIWVTCDPKLMTRAIRNLLVNAVVHNPEGTKIAVRIAQLHDRTTEIRVEDNGVGFSETLGQSEDRTSSTRSGLGLSIANKFIEAHDGDLVIHSKPSEGTTLSIRLKATQS
ncbi:His Kinase A (phospho-acceptor) domain-containing protein [Paenibacillus sp. UNC496MF]|uniref:sensor histidine kinase n=1 Tax=Paenibacillus sp. UNC496MF TaxID=1502753 RepID=UPI0008EAD3B7|nr:HAMP domain-containing sensor histidine kinase [Paenibacillus sp. UNC496MF]SFJ39982.1 His Kinase A (phospho-acceptor) domain-containing protein [Paenibacillus sp. UNC496MF]